MAILIVVVPVLIWWRRGRIALADLRPLMPWVFVSSVALVVAITLALREGPASVQPVPDYASPLTLPGHLSVAGRAIWFYALDAIFP